jgi:hypothetical protein
VSEVLFDGAVVGDSEGKDCLPMPVSVWPCKVKKQNHPCMNKKAQRGRWVLKILSVIA